MKTTLVSLISDQTIPNIQFIKEKKADNYLFISTESMEKKGVTHWIQDALGLSIELCTTIVVNPFNYDSIIQETEKVINDEDFYLVNLTGGTKLMTLAINDLFRSINAELYYLSGDQSYSKLFPGRVKPSFEFSEKLNLEEYLKSYGFKIKSISEPSIPFECTNAIFNYYLHSFSKDIDIEPLSYLLSKRGKNIPDLNECESLVPFLNRLKYNPLNENSLTKMETKFLTGDWFEEFFYHLLKKQNSNAISSIGTGWVIEKNGIPNELDIVYLHNDNLRIIECKTFIWSDPEEKKSIIIDTIYKSDSLKNKLGLFANTSIVTLSDLTSPKLIDHLNRAIDSKIAVYGKEDLLDLNTLISKFS
jgi:hypothetical protein